MNDRYMVIHPDTLEAMRRAGHVAKLEVRIEKLEAALNCNLPDYDPKIGIVERLRQLGNWRVDGTKSSPVYNKSADHIEKLEAALREIAALGYWDGDSAMSIARNALEGKDGT